jgi:hypothetical protein
MSYERVAVTFVCLFTSTLAAYAKPPADVKPLLLDDFETAPKDWKYIDGREFPGAKGSFTLDAADAHGGKRSYKLEADFSGGGAYVGVWRDLASLKGRDVNELHLWVKAVNVTNVGVRLSDNTDQIFQTKGVKLAPTADWQQVVLKISDLARGEHWGGAADGKWHGPIKAFGINIGKDSLAAGASKGSINIDDVQAIPGPVLDGRPTLLSGVLNPPSCRPGFAVRLTYRWDAEPMGRDFTVFVHIIGPDGKIDMQNDHEPPTPTSVWSGRVEYTNGILVPTDARDGDYRIMVGLYDRRAADRGWDHQVLKTGEGVKAGESRSGEPATEYQIGVLKVDSKAPLPQLPKATLNLDGYQRTFDDEFDDLSVSATGPGTRWFTATKENFGDARFVEQKDGFPFTVEKGILRIEAAKKAGVWQSGIIASVNPKGQGFSQKYGYFEMRAKFPKSRGMWPAFWLLGQPALTDKKRTNIEIDVVEHYGELPNAINSTMHLWPANGKHTGKGDFIAAPGLTDEFHNYGVFVDETNVIWYFDGVEIQRQKTPEEAKVPLYMIVNLAMGGGWPIDKAVSPSYMYVDYVRAYAKRP